MSILKMPHNAWKNYKGCVHQEMIDDMTSRPQCTWITNRKHKNQIKVNPLFINKIKIVQMSMPKRNKPRAPNIRIHKIQ